MSPTIRSKGGLPLMIGGLVAGADTCCCENPPPPFCGCADFCIYRIEVVSPSALANKSPIHRKCQDFVNNEITGQTITALPGNLCHTADCQPWLESGPSFASSQTSTTSGSHVFGLMVARVGERFLVTNFPEWCGCTGYINFGISAQIQCIGYENGPSRYVLVITCGYLVYQSNRFTDGSAYSQQANRVKVINLTSSECENIGDRTVCSATDWRARYMDTPLEFTASWATTSLGGYDNEKQFTGSEDRQFLTGMLELRDTLLSDFSATFRITSRPNCASPVGCNCNAPLRGMYVTFGNLKSKYNGVPFAFELNSSTVDFQRQITNLVQWQGPFGFYEWEEYDEDGPQDGAGNRTQVMTRQRAELYCDIVDGVSQWYVLFTSFCFQYDAGGTYTHQSYDQWVGKMDCYKACADAENFIEADEPVPMGEPYDIEYIGRTTVAGYLECEPPPRATISLRQIVTC